MCSSDTDFNGSSTRLVARLYRNFSMTPRVIVGLVRLRISVSKLDHHDNVTGGIDSVLGGS